MPSRRTFLGSIGAASLTGLAGCLDDVRGAIDGERTVFRDVSCAPPAHTWPTAGGDPGRTGWTETEPPAPDADGRDLLAGLRSNGMQRLASSMPAIWGDIAFVPSGSSLLALDLDSPGDDPRWERDFDDDLEAVPAITCLAILVPGLNSLTALEIGTGERYWRADVGGHGETTLAIEGRMAYVASSSPIAVRVNDGDDRWNVTGGDTIAAGNGVYSTLNVNGTGGIYAHDLDGEPRWHLSLGKIVSSASVDEGVVYVADNRGTVYAIDAATGETRWSRSPDGVGKIHSGLAVRHGVVAVPAGHGETSVLLDADTGETRWRAPTGIVTSRPLVSPDWVAFGRTNVGVTVYDRETGEERNSWTREAYDLGTVDGVVPVPNGFIVYEGTSSALTLIR